MNDDELNAMRGVLTALAFSLGLWSLIALVAYLGWRLAK